MDQREIYNGEEDLLSEYAPTHTAAKDLMQFSILSVSGYEVRRLTVLSSPCSEMINDVAVSTSTRDSDCPWTFGHASFSRD